MPVNKKQQEKKKAIQYGNAKEAAEKRSTFQSSTIKLPEGFKYFTVKAAGTYRFDIIPFRAGKGNPHAEEGVAWYERTFYINRNIGTDPMKQYPSLSMNWGEKDPVREFANEVMRDGDEELAKALKASQRQVFIVKDLKDSDHDGYKLFEYSYHGFGKKLDAKLRADEDNDYAGFFHLDGGLTVKATFEEKAIGQGKFYECVDIELKPRSEKYDDDLLEEMPCLDDLLVKPSYKEMKAVVDATGGDKEEKDDDDDQPVAKANKKIEKEEAPEDDEENDFDDEEVEEDEEEVKTADAIASELVPGVTVKFRDGKKTLTGVVKKANQTNKVALVVVEGKEKPVPVEFDQVLEVVDAEEETEDEEESEAPAQVRPKGGRAGEGDAGGDESEDDDEEIDDDEEEEAAGEPDAVEWVKGMKAKFKVGKKELTGVVVKVDKKAETLTINAGKSTPSVVDMDDESLSPVEDEDDSEEQDEEEEKPKGKKDAAKSAGKKTAFKEKEEAEEEDDDLGFDDE